MQDECSPLPRPHSSRSRFSQGSPGSSAAIMASDDENDGGYLPGCEGPTGRSRTRARLVKSCYWRCARVSTRRCIIANPRSQMSL